MKDRLYTLTILSLMLLALAGCNAEDTSTKTQQTEPNKNYVQQNIVQNDN